MVSIQNCMMTIFSYSKNVSFIQRTCSVQFEDDKSRQKNSLEGQQGLIDSTEKIHSFLNSIYLAFSIQYI